MLIMEILYLPVYQISLCCGVFHDLFWLPPWPGVHFLSSGTCEECVMLGNNLSSQVPRKKPNSSQELLSSATTQQASYLAVCIVLCCVMRKKCRKYFYGVVLILLFPKLFQLTNKNHTRIKGLIAIKSCFSDSLSRPFEMVPYTFGKDSITYKFILN